MPETCHASLLTVARSNPVALTGTNFATLNFTTSSVSSHTARGTRGERPERPPPDRPPTPPAMTPPAMAPPSDRRASEVSAREASASELKRDLTRGSNLLAELAGLHHARPLEQTSQARGTESRPPPPGTEDDSGPKAEVEVSQEHAATPPD